jgi:hypothetical protein
MIDLNTGAGITLGAGMKVSGSSTSTGSFGHLIVDQDLRVDADNNVTLYTKSSLGTVGIGDTNPTSKLSVYTGTSWNTTNALVYINNAEDVSTHGYALRVRGGANDASTRTFSVQDKDGNEDFIVYGTGNVEFPTGNVSGSSTSTGSFGQVYTAGKSYLGAGVDITGTLNVTKNGADNVVTVTTDENLELRLNRAGVGRKNELRFLTGNANKWNVGLTDSGDAGDGSEFFIGQSQGGANATITIDTDDHAAFKGNVSGSSTSTGSFGHLVIAKDAHIGEDVLADGDVVAYNSSDVRLKDNLQVIKGSLDKIGKINGYEFDWNEKSPGWARERGHDVGVIAQEVQKVLPEVVVERKSGYLGVDYKRLIPLLVESIKELKQEVENLKKKVN